MIQHWSRFNAETDEGAITYGWRHKTGRAMDKMGTVGVYPCDSEGWISRADHSPSAEMHSEIQVIQVWHNPKVENNVGTIRTLLDHVTQGYYLPDSGDGFKWELWQPLANQPEV